MPTTDTNVWDYVVTYGGPSLFMTAVFLFVMPLVWFKLARPRFQRWPSRLAVMLAVWLAAWFVAYGDVLMIAREAKRVCETEAGLKVYRTATVDGFAGMTGINQWAAKGFRYVEYVDVTGRTTIYRILDGIPSVAHAKEPVSAFEYFSEPEKLFGKLNIRREQVRAIDGRDVLGELVTYWPTLGWIDRLIGKYTGFNSAPEMCEGVGMISPTEKRLSYEDLIDATLIPSKG